MRCRLLVGHPVIFIKAGAKPVLGITIIMKVMSREHG